MKLKFALIALHLHGVLQFTETPHHTQSKKTFANGDVVQVVSEGGPARVSYATTGEGEKRKFNIKVNVPVGGGVFSPFTVPFEDNADRDRVLAAVKSALDEAHNANIGGATVLAPAEEAPQG